MKDTKENTFWRIILPKFKFQYKAKLIDTWYWCKDRETD